MADGKPRRLLSDIRLRFPLLCAFHQSRNKACPDNVTVFFIFKHGISSASLTGKSLRSVLIIHYPFLEAAPTYATAADGFSSQVSH